MFSSHRIFDGKTRKAELPEFMDKTENVNIRNFTYQGFDDFSPIVKAELEIKDPEIVEVIAPVSPPIFTVEDMELAKTLAREEGLQLGRAEAEKDFAEGKAAAEIEEEVRIADLIEKIKMELAILNEKAVDSNNKFADEIGSAAVAIAKKVCGEAGSQAIEDEISLIIKNLAGKLNDGETVKIYLNPRNIGALNDIFTNASLNVDEAVAMGDFRIEWKNGFAEKNLNKLWKTIEEVCSRHSSLEETVINNEEKHG